MLMWISMALAVQLATRFVTVDVPWTPSAAEVHLGGTAFSPVPDLLRPPLMQPPIALLETGSSAEQKKTAKKKRKTAKKKTAKKKK